MDDIEINIYDYAIDGKMITAMYHVNEFDIMTKGHKNAIRLMLIHQIANYIFDNNLVEFTQMKDPTSFESVVRARCFMVPDDQVKILRSVYKV